MMKDSVIAFCHRLMLTKIAVELNEKEDMMNPQCAGHFSAKGLETLGTAAGKALGAMRG